LFEFVSDFELRISDLPCYSSTPKVKKCKKSVQNMLKTRLFFAKRCKNLSIFDKKAQKNTHFYPHFYAKNE